MCWELIPTATGCILRFSDILQFPANADRCSIANSVLAGWHWYLDALEAALNGVKMPPDTPEVDYSDYPVPGRP